MSKKYKGKTCVYCGGVGISETRDHVLAREFVLKRHRGNLPIVPACASCNSAKSKLETELTTILPFGGRHVNAQENLLTMVPKRLRGNASPRSKIISGFEAESVLKHYDEPQMASAVLIDAEQIDKWLSLVATGLIWHHWRDVVANKVKVDPMHLTDEQGNYFARFFDDKVSRRVALASIGGDALIYEGIMSAECPLLSLWRIAVYGGLELAGDDPHARSTSSYIVVKPLREPHAIAEQ